MLKKLTACIFAIMVITLPAKVAEAAPLAQEPLFEIGDTAIYDFGIHYVEGFGEFELTPTSELEISPFVSFQGSRHMTLNQNFQSATTFTRNAPNKHIQLRHSHNGTVVFMVRNATHTANSFTVNIGAGVTVTRSLDSTVLNGQRGEVLARMPSGASTTAVTVRWWVHP